MEVLKEALSRKQAAQMARYAINKARQSSRSVVRRGTAVAAGVMLPALAFATEEGIDVSEVVSAITGHGAILVTIGAAVLGVLYLARVFSWARKI